MRVANVMEEGKLAGPHVRMVRVASALVGRVETLIVMPRENSEQFQEMCEANGVSYHVLPLTRITKEWRAALAYLLYSPWEILRLIQLFRREQIDIVHASGGSLQYKAVIAARLVGIPVVWHINDTSAPGWVRFVFRLLQPLANGFIFASHRSKTYYGDLISRGRPEAIVSSAVDLEHFDPKLKFTTDPDLPANGSDLVVGVVANVNPVKGLETLIRAAARLRDQGYRFNLVIVGAIFGRQRLYHQGLLDLAKQQGLDCLQFVGARADVRPLLACFDVYVCSSVAESSPVSVWEAMAMALPIVSTNVGDVGRHLHDGTKGFVVPVNDEVAMADKIARLLDAPERRTSMGLLAREAAKSFSPELVGQETFKMYAKLLSK